MWDASRDGFRSIIVLYSVAIVLGVFFCVILHEFGHAFMARRFGVRTHDIVMTPIGGIARLERMPEGKLQEFWVAIAGPVVNFVIVILIWLGFLFFSGIKLPIFSSAFWRFENQPPSYFLILLFANGYLGLFNLLPAFPMDGGRILRSLLSVRMSRERATQIAAYVGQALAIGIFIYALYNEQITLGLIGVFIFFAARQENQALQQSVKLQKTTIQSLITPVQYQLFQGQSMVDARRTIADVDEDAFIVWAGPGQAAGYVLKSRIMQIPLPGVYEGTIDAWILPSPGTLHENFSIGQAMQVMHQYQLPIVLVTDGYSITGTLTRKRLEGYIGE